MEPFILQDEGQSSHTADDYDRTVRELQFERRGQALDKLKSEEVLAREEKAKLEASEGVFPVPQTLEEFSSLMEQCTPAECQDTVEHIYTSNHPSLSASNRLQLQVILKASCSHFPLSCPSL